MPRSSPRHASPSPSAAHKRKGGADAVPLSAAKRPQRQGGTPGTITSLFPSSRAKDLIEEEKTPSTPDATAAREVVPATPLASPAATSSSSSPAALVAAAAGRTAVVTVTDDEESMLRGFDLSQRFGPCIGLTRLQRWRRADRFGLEPPQEALAILARLADDDPATMSIFSRRRI